MIHDELRISNEHNQDSAAEANAIRRIIQNTTIKLPLYRIDSHKELIALYQQDPVLHILKICHKRENQI